MNSLLGRLILTLVVSAVFAGCGASSQSSSAPPTVGASPSGGDPASIGLAFLAAVSRGDPATAEAMEDATMRAAAPAAKLQEIWQALVAQFGAFGSLGAATATAQPPYTVVTVEAAFANATVTLAVTVDAGGQVAGFHVGQVTTPSSGSSPSPAAYVDPGSFSESPVTIGSAPWTLPGTLSMPNGPGPFPAVVLVQGSGPNDRDETIGPNKPLRDLAWGLASRGIAVLRYDKRTFVYPAAMKAQLDTLTVRQETTDDAIAAIGLLRDTPRVDPGRVFLAGHSLGGYLAPRIAAGAPGELRGLVLLEANSTPLPQLIVTQSEYLASAGGSPSPSAETQLAALRAQVALADSPELTASTPASELPLGIPASYWLDLRTYDPLATAAGLRIPMFFSQGGRDYQVPPSELAGWQRALAGRDDVAFRVYPALDHLLFAGSGPSEPAEYMVPGQHVAAELVGDVAAWIASR
jgi:dienelactone hydrolase